MTLDVYVKVHNEEITPMALSDSALPELLDALRASVTAPIWSVSMPRAGLATRGYTELDVQKRITKPPAGAPHRLKLGLRWVEAASSWW